MAFPSELPGSQEIREEKVSEAHRGCDAKDAEEQVHPDMMLKIKQLPASFKTLVCNPTFMFLNLAGASEGMNQSRQNVPRVIKHARIAMPTKIWILTT